MKKLLVILSCLLSMFEFVGQNWNFKNVPSVIRRKEGSSELFFQVRNSMPMSHTMWVRYTLTGKNSGATPNVDFNTFNFVDTIKFGNNDTIATLRFRAVLDGVIEGNDTFVLKLVQASMGTIVSPDSTTIIIEDSTAAPITGRPLYTIGAIRGSNKDGIPDSINKTCSIRGTLYGINRRTTGYRMFICDATGCMGIFSNKTYSLLPAVNEGDSAEVSGTIEAFNGLGQIRFDATGDTIRKLGFNTNLRKPKVVTTLDETTESYLVKLDGLTLVSGSWFKDSAFDLTMKNISGTQFSVRIENKPTTNFGEPAAIKSGTTYYITGIGSQFDNSSNLTFTKGYQLLPRKLSDISTTNSSISQGKEGIEFSVFPTLATNVLHLFFESKSNEIGSLEVVDLLGKVVKSEKVKIVSGENLITLGQLETLTSGNYFIQLQSSSFQLNRQFSIVK